MPRNTDCGDMSMLDIEKTEKMLILPHIKPGGAAVDFTMGNGHDTLWLSRAMGADSRVYAFDVQQAALDNTGKLLKTENAPENYKLILDSHHNVKKYVREPICVGLFNLGWLPGSDRSVTTMRDTTLMAVKSAIELMDDDAGILIAVYPGHEEGRLEGEELELFLGTLSNKQFCVTKMRIINSPKAPYFLLLEKK